MQVVRDIHRLKLDSKGEPMEALLTRDLKHQSLMKTMGLSLQCDHACSEVPFSKCCI